MALDAYSACPCGSGKKFKWCCQPIHEQITQAFEQDAQGQHETALRMLEQVVAEHPGNPEVWGRKAQLLYQLDKAEEAEAALEKAMELSPNYPFGHYLRGRFRQFEGEIPGALLLFRKAADLYDPLAASVLAQIQALIFDCEMKLNHPVAARAALEVARRLEPGDTQLGPLLDQAFGEEGRLPPAARQEYKYKPLAASAPAARRGAWDKALSAAATGKLTDAVRAFEQLVQEDPKDAAALYNLGLTWAWLGNHLDAVAALDKYVSLESDEQQAAGAWTLAEVLRLGQGMEDQADVVEHSVTVPMRDPKALVDFLGKLNEAGRLLGIRVDQEQGALTALVLQNPGPALTPELQAQQSPHLGAYLLQVGNVLRLWNASREALESTYQEIREKVGPVLGEPYQTRGPAHFADLLSEALIFPTHLTDQAEAERRVGAHLERHFEEAWIHRPLKSLGGVAPVDASGHAVLRKKLLGVIQLLAQCAELAKLPYDFDRLRRKLGLTGPAPQGTAAPASGADIGAMSVAELAALAADSLSPEDLERAYQAALKLDARDLAGKFASALVSGPPRAERPDRFSWYNHLIQLAQGQSNLDEALSYVDQGEKDDCEQNEGRRRNDYELRRGQLHAKRGDTSQAQDVFERLIARVPDEVKFQVSAAESMLSARNPQAALRFAEQGLAKARQQQNRDSEGHLMELAAAAKKQGA